MVDKSNEYGYVPSSPTQAYGSNTGVFESNDIVDLINASEWSRPGQLELIETKDIAGATVLDFTNLGNYNVHFVTVNNFQPSTATSEALEVRLSNNGGTSFISSGYRNAYQYGGSTGTFGEGKSTSGVYFANGPFINNAGVGNYYFYLYNLLDSTKYSFHTFHSMDTRSAGDSYFVFGSNVLTTAETHNAFRLLLTTGTSNATSGTASLYGIRYS